MNAQASTVTMRSPMATLMSGYSVEITARESDQIASCASLLDGRTRISVTALPKEVTGLRIAAVCEVMRAGLRPVAHISARRLRSEEELADYLGCLKAVGAADDVFVVGGDPDTPHGPYHDALAVIESGLLEQFGVRHVGIGGYPERHPKIDEDALWAALKGKTRALARRGIGTSILTQFGFDAEPAIAWLGRLRAEGIEAPVRLGVPGPASAATLMRFATRCGVSASSAVFVKYGLSLTRLMQSTGPDRYVAALANGIDESVHGRVGLHFYPFGGLEKTARWIAERVTAA